MVFVTQTAQPQSARRAEQKVKAPTRLVPKRKFRAVAGHGRGKGKPAGCQNYSVGIGVLCTS